MLPVVVVALIIWLLVGESSEAGWRLVPKMLLSTGFVAIAVDQGGLSTAYGRWILAALVLSWLGDLALGVEGFFLPGLVSFAAAHVAYWFGFLQAGVDTGAVLIGVVAMVGVGAAVLRWLRPHLEGAFATAVPAYVLIIGVMVALAVGTRSVEIWLPAAAFAASDIAVARNQFVESAFINRVWGLPLYFVAQYALALTV